MSKKLAVTLLFGGKSVEHAISINSARNIYEFIDHSQYEVTLIGISSDGHWFLKKEVNDDFDGCEEISFSLNPRKKGFINQKTGELLSPDIVFPVLHGTDGEDGSIQGMLTAMDIPFVGTGVLGSALSMNKLYSKRMMANAGIPTSRYLEYEKKDMGHISYSEISLHLGVPFMAKAANLGSSVGIFKVKDEDSFKKAVKEVFNYDNILLCESFVEGRELECSVMGNDTPIASKPAEIIVSNAYDFYTYEAKYLNEKAVELKVPAELSENISEKIREISIQAYQALHCEDFARVDLFLQKDETILINEINTIPGFTNHSMFPMMWKERGISFTELISKLIDFALERNKKNASLVKSYSPS